MSREDEKTQVIHEVFRQHGKVRPELLVEAASNPAHPFHWIFDKKAVHQPEDG